MVVRPNRYNNINWKTIGIAAGTLAIIIAIIAGLIFFVGTGAKTPTPTETSSSESEFPDIAEGIEPAETSENDSEVETIETGSISGELPEIDITEDLSTEVRNILNDNTPVNSDNLSTRFVSSIENQADVENIVGQITEYNIYQFNNLLYAAQEISTSEDYNYIASFYRNFYDADWYWDFAPTNYRYSDGNYFSKFETAMYYGYYIKQHLLDGRIFCVDMFQDMSNYTFEELPTNYIELGSSGVLMCEQYPGIGLVYTLFQIYPDTTDFTSHTFVYGIPSANIESYDNWSTGSIEPAYVVPVQDQTTGETFGILFDYDNNLIGIL